MARKSKAAPNSDSGTAQAAGWFVRRYTFKLYPNATQLKRLMEVLELHRVLYNAALFERIDAYEKTRNRPEWQAALLKVSHLKDELKTTKNAGRKAQLTALIKEVTNKVPPSCKPVTINFNDQCKSLTKIRAEDPAQASLRCNSQQATLKRLDDAFSAFFKKGGFPKFKGRDFFRSWSYTNTEIFKFWHTGGKNYKTFAGDIGEIRSRGRLPKIDGLELRTLSIIKEADGWYASVVVRYPNPARKSGSDVIGVDWGVSRFLSIVTHDGDRIAIENPRIGRKGSIRKKQVQQELSRCKKGSNRRRKVKKRLSILELKIARQRKDFRHQVTNQIVSKNAVIAFETLNVKNMTKSASGDLENPGTMVAQKAGLNREISDTAPGAFFETLEYKAKEAGARIVEVDARKARPSQTCPACGTVRKKKLSDRVHSCEACGYEEDRDFAAARVVLDIAVAEMGRDPACDG